MESPIDTFKSDSFEREASKKMAKLWMPIKKDYSGNYIGILSDTSIDRDNEIMSKELLEKWAEKDFYMPALINHENKVESNVGKWVDKRVISNGKHYALIAKPVFFKSNPKAQMIEGMLNEGANIGLSIGAIPKKSTEKVIENMTYKEWKDAELVEGSFVPVGSNRNTFAMVAKSFNLDEHITKPAALERCVEHLMNDPNFKPKPGRTKRESAYAVCQASTKSLLETFKENVEDVEAYLKHLNSLDKESLCPIQISLMEEFKMDDKMKKDEDVNSQEDKQEQENTENTENTEESVSEENKKLKEELSEMRKQLSEIGKAIINRKGISEPQEPQFTTNTLSPVEAEYSFDSLHGLAGLKHGECYYNPWSFAVGGEIDGTPAGAPKIDKRIEVGQKWMQKQSIETTTGGAGTAGYALIPVYVDPEIVDQTRYLTPLVELIPRRASKGLTYDYNKITAKGGAKWKAEDAAQLEDTDTYDRGSVSMKYGYSVGRVTGPAIAAMRGYNDAMQLDLSVKTQALKELEEDTIINGDSSTYPTEYDGLINSITTNTTNKSSNYVTLADIRAELATTFNARGMVTLAVTDAATHNYIKGLLQEYQRSAPAAAENLPFGIRGAFNFDGVDFIKSQFMPTSSGSRRILFLDMRYIHMAVLQDVTYEELAKTNDSNKYMLKVYEALVVTYEGACSQIYGIK